MVGYLDRRLRLSFPALGVGDFIRLSGWIGRIHFDSRLLHLILLESPRAAFSTRNLDWGGIRLPRRPFLVSVIVQRGYQNRFRLVIRIFYSGPRWSTRQSHIALAIGEILAQRDHFRP
jgi:hypothetical protein